MQTNLKPHEPTLVIDSDDRFVSFQEMILLLGEHTDNVSKSTEFITSLFVPNAEIVQVNNTVLQFITKKIKGKTVAVGALINLDTAKNALTNTVDILSSLQRQGVDIFTSQFKGGNQAQGFKVIGKTFDRFGIDTKISVGSKKTQSDNKHLVVVEFGKDPIEDGPKQNTQRRGK